MRAIQHIILFSFFVLFKYWEVYKFNDLFILLLQTKKLNFAWIWQSNLYWERIFGEYWIYRTIQHNSELCHFQSKRESNTFENRIIVLCYMAIVLSKHFLALLSTKIKLWHTKKIRESDKGQTVLTCASRLVYIMVL